MILINEIKSQEQSEGLIFNKEKMKWVPITAAIRAGDVIKPRVKSALVLNTT